MGSSSAVTTGDAGAPSTTAPPLTAGRPTVTNGLAQISLDPNGLPQPFGKGTYTILNAKITKDGSRVFYTTNSRDELPETGPYAPSGYPYDSYYLLTRDLKTNSVEMVTTMSTHSPPRRVPVQPSGFAVSSDGRFLAFEQFEGLDPRFPDVYSGIYKLDRLTGSIKMVSVDSSGVPFDGLGTVLSDALSITPDGRFIVFNVIDASTGSAFYDADIYIYDSLQDTVELVTRGRLGTDSNRVISADGNVLIFENENLLPGDPVNQSQLYRLDRRTNTIININKSGNDNPIGHTLTDNGRFIVYRASVGGLGVNTAPQAHRLMVYDAQQNRTVQANFSESGNRIDLFRQLVFGLQEPFYDISEDGQWLVFVGHASERYSEGRTVYLKNLFTGELKRIASPDQVNVSNPPRNSQGNTLFRALSPTISGDGSKIIYTNFIANPAPDERSYFLYLYDNLAKSQAILNFVAPEEGPRIEAHSGQPTLTSDGELIAFRSLSNLDDSLPPIFTSFMRTFLFKVTDGSLIETSVGKDGERIESPNRFPSAFEFFSSESVIAGDGGAVYITTDLALHGGDLDYRNFVYDLVSGVTSFLYEFGAAIDVSEDGRFLVFRQLGGYRIRDLQSQTDLAVGKFEGRPRVSKDGNRVLFSKTVPNAKGENWHQLHLYEVSTDSTFQLTNGATSSGFTSTYDESADTNRFEISSDGRWGAFSSSASDLLPFDTNSLDDLFVVDLNTFQLTRIQGSEQPNGASYEPSMSSTGRYIAFTSYATNLVANDTNGVSDVFVLDRSTGEFRIVSSGVDGAQADGNSGEPFISDDGRYIAFSSEASNLTVEGSRRGIRQVYRVANPFVVEP